MSPRPRPRIHWVSPLPPADTDIAHYTARILPDLAARAEVVLWTDKPGHDPALEAHAAVRRFDPAAPAPMDLGVLGVSGPGEEAIFLHIGNSGDHHSAILALAERVPGIVVLHDLALQDLLNNMLAHGRLDPGRYRDGMARWYGRAGAEAGAALVEKRANPPDLIAAFPGWELTLGRAVAVLTHTGPAFRAVAARRHVPAYRLELPFRVGPEPALARAKDGPLRLVQFGHTGTNRRIDTILEVLAGLVPGVDFRLDLYGSLWDEGHVLGRIAELGLGDRVAFHGFVEEAALDRALGEAHLVFNLRHPTMGEASGSQLRIWNAGAASVVSDQGWYATLPEATAFRVPPAGEERALADLIRGIDADRGRVEAVGRAGRAHLAARHGTETYARGIAAIAEASRADAHAGLVAERARRLLDAMGRAEPASPIAARALARLIPEAP